MTSLLDAGKATVIVLLSWRGALLRWCLSPFFHKLYDTWWMHLWKLQFQKVLVKWCVIRVGSISSSITLGHMTCLLEATNESNSWLKFKFFSHEELYIIRVRPISVYTTLWHMTLTCLLDVVKATGRESSSSFLVKRLIGPLNLTLTQVPYPFHAWLIPNPHIVSSHYFF